MTGSTMTWAILLFALGFVLLIKGGDWFVDGAVSIARRFHVPELLIGATIVSIGTTLPEVMVSATAALQGQSGTSYGNAIGSIICNTALISALTIAIRPSGADRKTLLRPVVFFFGAALFYSLIAYTTGSFERGHGIVLLCGFAAYMIWSVVSGMKGREVQATEDDAADEGGEGDFFEKWLQKILQGKAVQLVSLILLVVGAALIAVGAKLLVDNGTFIAKELGVPETVIALTFVALGTSLPELVTAVTALVKGHSALSLGNIVGANLFNLVLVSGTAITLSPFAVPAEKQIFGVNASLAVDIPLALAVMAIMTLPAMKKGKLERWQGILMLCMYGAYCVFQFAF